MKTKDILLLGAGATIVYLLWKKSKKSKSLEELAGGGASGGASGSATTGAVSNQPEQVYGLNLPSSMDLPTLTAGTGVATEVAVQQGGVATTPTPAIVTTPALSVNEALGGIVNVIPKTFPVVSNCEQKWLEYSAVIKPTSQEAFNEMKASFIAKCESGSTEPILPKSPIKYPNFPVSEELSATPIVVERTMQEQLYSSANGSKPRYIKARLFRGVM